MKHPIQPLVVDSHGTIRFKENKIVRYLLDDSRHSLNSLGVIPFDENDREQFLQLIGFSVTGFQDFDCVTDKTKEKVLKQFDKLETELLKKEKK